MESKYGHAGGDAELHHVELGKSLWRFVQWSLRGSCPFSIADLYGLVFRYLSSFLTDRGPTGANFLNFPPSVVALAALLWHLTKNSEQSPLLKSFVLNDLSDKIVQPTISLFDTRRLVCESQLSF